MLRKERVWRILNELCHQKISDEQLSSQERVGFTTLEVADLLSLDRANTSRDLNQLVEEKRVVKLPGKPVLYLDRCFLEKRLGLVLNQTSFSSLTLLQNAKLAVTTKTVPHLKTTATSIQHLHRAVRWLDLPEEETSSTLNGYISGQNNRHFMVSGSRFSQQPFYQIGIVVVAYGRTTASSMAEAACQLASTNGECAGGLALDVELEADYNWVLEQTERLIRLSSIEHPDGVLLLVDLPKLAQLEDIINQRTGFKLKAVENVNTLMLVEALRCANAGQHSLEELAAHLRQDTINLE